MGDGGFDPDGVLTAGIGVLWLLLAGMFASFQLPLEGAVALQRVAVAYGIGIVAVPVVVATAYLLGIVSVRLIRVVVDDV